MNKHEGIPDPEKIKEILDVVSEKIPGLLKELSSLLYSPESAKQCTGIGRSTEPCYCLRKTYQLRHYFGTYHFFACRNSIR